MCGHRPGPDFYQPVAIVIRPIQKLNFDSASNSAVIASIFPRLSFPAHILVVALVSLDMWQLAAQFTDACARILFMHASSALEQIASNCAVELLIEW